MYELLTICNQYEQINPNSIRVCTLFYQYKKNNINRHIVLFSSLKIKNENCDIHNQYKIVITCLKQGQSGTLSLEGSSEMIFSHYEEVYIYVPMVAASMEVLDHNKNLECEGLWEKVFSCVKELCCDEWTEQECNCEDEMLYKFFIPMDCSGYLSKENIRLAKRFCTNNVMLLNSFVQLHMHKENITSLLKTNLFRLDDGIIIDW